MADDAVALAALRGGWQHVPARLDPVSLGGTAATAWVASISGACHLVARVPLGKRLRFEAGLTAACHLAERGMAAGEPVRALSGALVAEHDGWAYGLVRCPPGRPLAAGDPIDQQWWGDALARLHAGMDGFAHAGLAPWHRVRPEAAHLDLEPWLRPAVVAAYSALTRLCVTDRLTYGVLHGRPGPAVFRLDPATGRTGVVCWGPAATGPLVADLAAAVTHAGGTGTDELVDGYAAAGAVHRDEIDAALPVLLPFHWAARADAAARRLATAPTDESARTTLAAARAALAAA
ncbi:phosphotransferase [Asanoa sp. WMMD1127]|uniref:phosphotransferase enzyme family protein n=1 Tax=Asanoa sp. WMMD1127 TaxID=3016107 RepID=UPI00241649DD|nr:phosphotransferase [Asanoa sp. WMMD1127]MDG4827142.1 phosphotransferase [Asanoa sp. WMMD1127]